jgi:hypothetical protein
MSKPLTFAQQSMAASGIAIWSSEIAYKMRPDMWSGPMDCAGDFGTRYSKSLAENYLVDECHAAIVTFEGIGYPVRVIARSSDQLAMRLEWLTGRKVLKMLVHSPVIRQEPKADSQRETAPPKNGDRFAGVLTKEPGRTCAGCDHFTPGHSCRRSDASGIAVPNVNVVRRCPAFVPLFENLDSRSGAQLWPELVGLAQGSKELEVNHVGV